jgi:hypothetical protein
MRLGGCGSIVGRSPGDARIHRGILARSRRIPRLIRPIVEQRRPSDWVQWNVESSEVTIEPPVEFSFSHCDPHSGWPNALIYA